MGMWERRRGRACRTSTANEARQRPQHHRPQHSFRSWGFCFPRRLFPVEGKWYNGPSEPMQVFIITLSRVHVSELTRRPTTNAIKSMLSSSIFDQTLLSSRKSATTVCITYCMPHMTRHTAFCYLSTSVTGIIQKPRQHQRSWLKSWWQKIMAETAESPSWPPSAPSRFCFDSCSQQDQVGELCHCNARYNRYKRYYRNTFQINMRSIF